MSSTSSKTKCHAFEFLQTFSYALCKSRKLYLNQGAKVIKVEPGTKGSLRWTQNLSS